MKLTAATKWRLTVLSIAVAVAGVLYWTFRQYASLETLIEHEVQLRGWIASHPLTAWAIGFVVYVAASLIPGTGGKSVVYGWLFGFWPAVVIANCSLTISAIITFLFSRYLFHDAVQSRFGAYLYRFNQAVRREGAFYLLTLRLMLAPYSFINYVSGATPLRTRTFWWTTQLGLLPGTAIWVFAGTRLPSLRELAKKGPESLLDPLLFAALAFISLAPLVVRLVILRSRRQADDSL